MYSICFVFSQLDLPERACYPEIRRKPQFHPLTSLLFATHLLKLDVAMCNGNQRRERHCTIRSDCLVRCAR
jgi:hypothetical protein